MVKPWKLLNACSCVASSFLCLLLVLSRCSAEETKLNRVERELRRYVDDVLGVDRLNVLPGVRIERSVPVENATRDGREGGRNIEGFEEYFKDRLKRYTDTHLVSVNVPETARFFFKGDDSSSKPG